MATTEGREQGTLGAAPVRGTQSFVHTLSECWGRPGLTGLEVLWRWAVGVPALALIYTQSKRILAAHTDGTYDVTRLGLDRGFLHDPVGTAAANPMGVTAKLGEAVSLVLPDVLHVARWMVPLLVVVWVVVSSLGRTAVLRRIDARLEARPGTLMVLQGIRMLALLACFGLWFGCLREAVNVAVNQPIAAGGEPNLVLYFGVMIVSTLGLFTGWAVVSWALSVAPLLAMLKGLGVWGSLKAALRLGPMKAKLVEVNLVLGIVKIALIVLAMVFSATPLPFESVTTTTFLVWWWVGVTVFYLAGSDFFHVARLMGYLELWRAYEGDTSQ